MRFVVDYDGVVTKGVHKILKEDVELNVDVVQKINHYYDKGCHITIYTSRGALSCDGDIVKIEKTYRNMIETTLRNGGVKYHELVFGKVSGDVYIDDLGLSPQQFINQKHILIGKFGRKIIFNKANYSKKGGHFEITSMVEILSQQHKLYLFGDFDEVPNHPNIVKFDEAAHFKLIDLIYVDNGVGAWQEIAKDCDKALLDNTNRMVRQINMCHAPVFYSFTDPRLPIDKDRINERVIIINQNEHVNRGHQEKLCLLQYPQYDNEFKFDKLVIIGRDNGRARIYDEFISAAREIVAVEVYGDFKLKDNADVCMGEIQANCVGSIYSGAKYSLMVAVGESWLTQKLIEVMHFHCVPIMYGAYDNNELETEDLGLLKVNTPEELTLLLRTLTQSKDLYYKLLYDISRKLKPRWYDKVKWLEYYNNLFEENLHG